MESPQLLPDGDRVPNGIASLQGFNATFNRGCKKGIGQVKGEGQISSTEQRVIPGRVEPAIALGRADIESLKGASQQLQNRGGNRTVLRVTQKSNIGTQALVGLPSNACRG